ncbi:UNVERIFIED_CONTAM: 2-aminoethylphosphonate--pyruvate transaminase/phosphonoacetaldehyde hydrolase [Brevibacillus sp. OAP136]
MIKAVIFDWAGTTVDYGCFAPLAVFLEVFRKRGIELTAEEARKPMGLLKRDHIKALLEMERVGNLWRQQFGSEWTEADIDLLYVDFEALLFQVLRNYAEPIKGVPEMVVQLREDGLKIGSTTGYTAEMMAIVTEEARARGYEPDLLVTPTEMPAGRPHPYMIFQNAIKLGVPTMHEIIKVGDTVSDIAEGVNAGVWSIGVIKGGSELGLTEAEVAALHPVALREKMSEVRDRFRNAGAHLVIDAITELPAAIQLINQRLAKGERPTMAAGNPYLLLTPGPLTTSPSVKQAMLKDWCTWDKDYNGLVQAIRHKLVALATQDTDTYTAVLMQGSGSFSVESVIGSVIPKEGKLAVITNGAYGNRIVQMASVYGISTAVIDCGEVGSVDPRQLDDLLARETAITHVMVVHCETTTGMLNPIADIGRVAKDHGKVFIVDAMSSFGGIPFDMADWQIDFLISSANKCIQGVPGFGFIIARRDELEACKGQARSLSLDLYDQWETMERDNGKWRFTSPTHVVRAFYQALLELEAEGGVAARHERYATNQRTLVEGMKRIGFKPLLEEEHQSPIITSFLYPESSAFTFAEFYSRLKQSGFVIYPGKITAADTFRIGNIGDVEPTDMERLVAAITQHQFWR